MSGSNAGNARKKKWAARFLEALESSPNVAAACRAAGIARKTAYAERQANEDFALAWHDALDKSLDELEQALFERACEKDTVAAIFLLKSHRPAIYQDKVAVEHSGKVKTETVEVPDDHDRQQRVAEILASAGALNGSGPN